MTRYVLPESVGVIGAGTMGAGIGLAFAAAGCRDVRLMARHDASLARAGARVDDGLQRLVSEHVLIRMWHTLRGRPAGDSDNVSGGGRDVSIAH